MTTREELEAALIQAPDDRDVLAVYGDHLQAAGDLCGELIALDLRIERYADPSVAGPRRYRRAPVELLAQRATVLRAVLGSELSPERASSWLGDAVRLGFVDDLAIGATMRRELAALLASPVGRYIRSITLHGDSAEISMLLAMLARTHHAWLTCLTIVVTSAGPLIDFEREVVAAMPRLARLELRGHPVLRTMSHPALRTLCIEGAVAKSLRELELSGVTALDVAFAIQDDVLGALIEDSADLTQDWSNGALAALFSVERLPDLRRLDLSRSEQAFDAWYWGERPLDVPLLVFALLGQIPLRHRLTHVRLPAVYTEVDQEYLSRALAMMPELVELEIVRGSYFDTSGLTHLAARIVRRPPWPWPEDGELDEALRFVFERRYPDGGSRSVSVTITVQELRRTMELQFEDMPSNAREAWTRFWVQAGTLRLGGPRQVLPTEVALTMLSALPRSDMPLSLTELCDQALRYDGESADAAIVIRIAAASVSAPA